MQNWRARDFNLYDDFRPIWEDLDINQRKRERQELIMQLNQDTWWTRFLFKMYESRFYGKTNRRANWITNQILNRAMIYCNSLEFTRIL